MKTSIFLAFCCLLLLSCKKTANFHVKIVNPSTGEGYANHEFNIKSSKTGSDGQIVKTEFTGFTDQNGDAIVPLKIKKSVAHYVTPAVVPNTCYINSIDLYYNNTSDSNPEFTFEIAPCGKIKVNIHNVNCEGPNDTLIIERNYQHGTDNVYLPVTIVGCYSQPGVAVSVPMGNYEIKWTVIRSGNSQTFTDMLFVPKEGEGIGEYTINY